jgi:hypothetical protein
VGSHCVCVDLPASGALMLDAAHQFFYRSMATGVSARSALIAAMYHRVFRLSTGARLQHPNGKLTTAISSDVSRVDYCAQCGWSKRPG